MLAAAEAHDVARLAQQMSDDFSTSIVEEEPARAELLKRWRSHPESLDRLAVLLRGECAFVETQDHWVCPRSLVEQPGEPGETERIHLVREDERWRWGAFIESEDFRSPTRERTAPPHLDPVVTESGSETYDPVRAVVRAHISEVRRCFADGSSERAELRRKVTVDFVIAGDGRVESAVAKPDQPDRELALCVAAAVKTWQFPAPEDGRRVVVTYPFVYEPG